MIIGVDYLNPLVIRNARGWAIPRALLRPMLDSLKVRTDPQTGREFSQAIAGFLGVNIASGQIQAIESGGHSFLSFLTGDFQIALGRCIEAYNKFRSANPIHSLLVDVRVGDALFSVASIIDEYAMKWPLATDRDLGSLAAVRKQLYRFLLGLQRRPSDQKIDFPALKALISTGRCDGLSTLGQPYIAASLKELFRLQPGLVFGEVAATLADFVSDNFSSRIGPQLFRTCREGVSNFIKTAGKMCQSKLGAAADLEFARLVGRLGRECEELVLKGNQDPRLAGAAARFYANCVSVFPKDERLALRRMMISTGNSLLKAECFLAAPWIADNAIPGGWERVVADQIESLLLARRTHLPLSETPIQRSRDRKLMPSFGALRTVALSLNSAIVDGVLPHVADGKLPIGAWGELIAMRLQAERAMPLTPSDGLLFATTFTNSLGLFASNNPDRINQDLVLFRGLVAAGTVVEMAKALNILSYYFDQKTCRQIATVYVADSYAMIKDIEEILALCSAKVVGDKPLSIGMCKSMPEILAQISALVKK